MISEQSKNRLKHLAGLISENLKLVPDISGRSDKNTLSWFVEEYILNISNIIINSIDLSLSQSGYRVAISKSNTKMQKNSLSALLIVNNDKKYMFTAMVNFEQGANTSVSISHNQMIEQFNLNSHHSLNDINLFIKEIVNYITNSLK